MASLKEIKYSSINYKFVNKKWRLRKNKMKKIITIFGAFIISCSAFAQQSTNFSVYVINSTNCPYSITGTWWDTSGAGSVTWNSVDTTSSFQDVWSATVLTNTSTDNMIICVVPAPPCTCPQVCITQPVSPGSYTLQLCNGVGINEIGTVNNFSVYPNPANSQINVKADETLLGSIYNIYDNTGKRVLSGKINSANTIIELGKLSGGIYLFSLGENLQQTFKFIKD